MAQLCSEPAAIPVAVPATPFTDVGGVACPLSFLPQQTTALVPAWIAQLCAALAPPAIAIAVPAIPFTESGGVDCP
jgi:hypothetical protein